MILIGLAKKGNLYIDNVFEEYKINEKYDFMKKPGLAIQNRVQIIIQLLRAATGRYREWPSKSCRRAPRLPHRGRQRRETRRPDKPRRIRPSSAAP